MTMAKPKKGDPRTVEVTKDGVNHWVTPEVAGKLDHQGWERVGGPQSDSDAAVEQATAPLVARIAELEAQLDAYRTGQAGDLPTTAAELIDWVGSDPDRARQAQALEAARPDPRKTVIEHLESVLNPSPPKED